MGINNLQETAPFDILPEEVVQQLRQSAQEACYPADTHIFEQNAPTTGYLYVIQDGMVEITATVPGGEEMVVDYRKAGNFFGGTPIFTDQPYTGGARAVNETHCFLIPKETLTTVAVDYPQIREYFTRIVLSRVRSLYADIVKENTKNALTQMEAYPFRKRLSEIMHAPVETCQVDTPVREVARRMTAKTISSMIVVDPYDAPIGIITERDLVVKVLAPNRANADAMLAADIMTLHSHALPPATYMYEALNYITAHNIKHLPVVDKEELVGIVTLHDLMRYRCQKAMLLVGSVREEESFEGLARIRREVLTVARTLLTETLSTPEVFEILSYIHHSIMKKVYTICHQQMLDEGYQEPDIRYTFLLMGSGGRREMLLNPDQDNAFVFEDFPDSRAEEVDAFFAPFGKKLVAALAEVGYSRCQGKVMADNPAWRGRLRDWRSRIHEWVNDPQPQRVRYSSIFFDFIGLTGDTTLAEELQKVVFGEIRAFRRFLYHMMTLDQKDKVPLGLLGRFQLEKEGEHKGQLSLKQGGTVFIVDCIRIFALEKDISESSTLKRLSALTKDRVFETETAEHIKAAFEALFFLRLRHEIALLEKGAPPSHYIDPHRLPKSEQELLKEAFNAVSKLQDATRRHFTKSFI